MANSEADKLEWHSADVDIRVSRYGKDVMELLQYPLPQFPTPQPPLLRIVATGDSWFDYPLRDPVLKYTDTIECLRASLRAGTVIGNIACYGAQVVPAAEASRPAIAGDAQLKRLRTMLTAGADAMLVSGGGNDVADGPQTDIALNPLYVLLSEHAPGKPLAEALNPAEVDALFARVRDGMLKLVAARDALRPGIPVIFNAYGFAFPDDRPARWVLAPKLAGPWLFPALKARGWMTSPTAPADLDVGRAIVRDLLERYRAMLLALPGDNLHVADTQAVPLDNRLADWANELHPSESGFRQVAATFQAKLESLFGRDVVTAPPAVPGV